MSRREVLAAMSATTAIPVSRLLAPVGAPGSAPGKMTSQRSGAPGYLFFDAGEARLIEAACGRLIPADVSGPGALGAGVPHYVDRQLAGAWGAGERLYRDGPWQPGTSPNGQAPLSTPAAPLSKPAEIFRIAIRAISRDLERLGPPHGVPFDELPVDAQDSYLRSLESGTKNLDGVPSTVFFAMLLEMTVESFFSDPLHGGVREKISWRMQGYPGAHAAQPLASAAGGSRRREVAQLREGARRQETPGDIP